MTKTLFYFPSSQDQATKFAEQLKLPAQSVIARKFPDGESLVKIPLPISPHVIIFYSLDNPNSKLIELFFAAQTARNHGAQRITLVAPYLCYMRQDIENTPGEAVSQKIIGQMLADHFDDVITVDPHLHRIDRLEQAIPIKRALSLSATQLIGAYIAKNYEKPVLLGPDSESEQWVAQVAAKTNLDYAIAHKVRHGDREVDILLPDFDFRQRQVIIIDDMISSGGTAIEICRLLQSHKVTVVDIIITHILCSAEDEKKIHAAGIRNIISTDSIAHHTNKIELSSLLATAVKGIA